VKKYLKDITEIRSGIYAQPAASGDIIYLQGKHFSSVGKLREPLYPELKMDDKMKKHLLTEGDILVASKGIKNFASLYHIKMGIAIASSTFIVVHIKDEFKRALLPEYLTWAINHPRSQEYIRNNTIGTAVQSLSIKALGDLQIPVPTLEKQQNIVHLSKLLGKEHLLKKQIENLRLQQMQRQLLMTAEQ
jgi:restriction endonuclease S subunit